MNIVSILKGIINIFQKTQTPAQVLPNILLRATSIMRPGLSSMDIASKVIANNNALGINTGPNPDGSENIVNQFTYNIVKEVVAALQEEGAIQIIIPAGSLRITAEGGNAGGPVTVVGTNTNNAVAKGIIQ